MLVAWMTAVALLALSLVPGVAPWLADRLPGNGDAGFPQRVGFIRGAPMLPDKPGPLALIVVDNNFGAATLEAVSASGRAYTLPATYDASLSPDGRLLMTHGERRISVRDLTSGQVQAATVDRPLRSAGAWSSDGSRLLLSISRKLNGYAAVLDTATGRLTTSTVRARPVGFLPDGRIVALKTTDDDTRVMVLDSALAVLSTAPLRPTDGWADGGPNDATVNPEGQLMTREGPDDGRVLFRTFSVTDGTQSRQLVAEVGGRSVAYGCPMGWRGADPVIVTKTDGTPARVVQVHPDGSTTQLLAIHHRMQSLCVAFSADALRAGPGRALLGANDAVWTWYWRPLLLMLLLAGGALTWLLSRRRRSSPS